MELAICVGLQGSGKSTFCRNVLFDSHLRLNLDMLRTRHRERLLFEACLAAKQRVVIDNTNPTPEDRARYMAAAKAANFHATAYVFDVPLEVCLERNGLREGKALIPEIALRGTYRRIVWPTLEEGFDAILHVRAAAGGGFEVLEQPA